MNSVLYSERFDELSDRVSDSLNTSKIFAEMQPEVNTFLIADRIPDHMHSSFPGWEIPKFCPEHFTYDYGFIVFLLLAL